MKISKEKYLKALQIVETYRDQNPGDKEDDMSIVELEIRDANAIEDEEDRLDAFRQIAEDIANQFTYDMSILEPAIEEALNNVSRKTREKTKYWSVSDVTQDINVTSSHQW